MKIRMLETRRGSEDGFKLLRFYKDLVYDVAEGMGRQFVKNGWAIRAESEQELLQEIFNDIRATRRAVC